jgi:hypothetical protein
VSRHVTGAEDGGNHAEQNERCRIPDHVDI